MDTLDLYPGRPVEYMKIACTGKLSPPLGLAGSTRRSSRTANCPSPSPTSKVFPNPALLVFSCWPL